MYYEIRNWNKVKAGEYGSDQQTFDYREAEYKPLYRIKKREGTWGVFKAKEITWDALAGKDCESHIAYYHIGECRTLVEAKTYAEKEFGITYRVDDMDRR